MFFSLFQLDSFGVFVYGRKMFVFTERKRTGRKFIGGKNKWKTIRSSIHARSPNNLSTGKKQFRKQTK